jgi:methyl-accepting chemotaxis protein
MGHSVQKILDENYRSINAAKEMIEALEREDSAILTLLLGIKEEGKNILFKADSVFNKNLVIAEHNITLAGEAEIVTRIKSSYSAYRQLWQSEIMNMDPETNRELLMTRGHSSFLEVKSAAADLLNLNDRAMYRTASDLQSRSQRATMPGIITVIAALIFTLIFNYLVNYFMISPIVTMTRNIKQFIEKRKPFEFDIETHDEISDLARSIQDLSAIIQSRAEK